MPEYSTLDLPFIHKLEFTGRVPSGSSLIQTSREVCGAAVRGFTQALETFYPDEISKHTVLGEVSRSVTMQQV